ncbi:MAG: tetratricopeptide repeat protein [Prevotella sp.]|nr:tetratricopeptide repeat protein [Prevotella sp.]
MNVKRHYILLLFIVLAAVCHAQADRQFIREGNKLYRQKQYAQAEICYRKAVASNANNPQAVYNLGCALMMQQKDSAAVVQYEKAAKMETNKMRLSKSYHNIGVICQNHQMYGEAIQAYQQSLRNNPSDNETRYNLALCKKKQKQQDQNKQNNKDKQQEKKQEDKDKQNQQQQKDKEKQQQQSPDQQMSKENAEQLLNAAIQNEKATQQRMKKALQQPKRRTSEKNW